jgi:hypothetical protein
MTGRDFGSAFYHAVSSGQLDSYKASRPGTWNMPSVPPLTPRHLKMVLVSIDPHLLTAFPGRRDGQQVQGVYRGSFGFTGVAARCFASVVQGHLSP